MYGITEDLTTEYILSYISQEEIFSHFLGIEVKVGRYFRSTLRKDKHPTCTFAWYNNTLWYRDWAENKPRDCFNIVMHIHNCSFINALAIIEREMINGKDSISKRTDTIIKGKKTDNKEKSVIRVKFSQWQDQVIEYLQSYGISSKLCKKYNIKPIKKVWLNGRINWIYKQSDPALGYYFGKDEQGNEKWKIYFYKRNNMRFICNTSRINGWVQIPEKGNNLIITKSLKDVVCIDKFGIPSIAMQAESQTPYDYIIEELKNRFNNIITLFDHDAAGIRQSNIIKQEYNIQSKYIINNKAKDFSDYIKEYGQEKAEILINKLL